MIRFFSCCLLTAAIGLCSFAETQDSDKLKITPTARALFDAACYTPEGSEFRPGFAIPDVRLGAKANFGRFEARADLSYRFGKLYPADIYLQYSFNDRSLVKGGYFVHQFGLQSATGASHKISMEQPIAESAMGEPRLLGAMYVWHDPKLHFAGSLFAQTQTAIEPANKLGRTGVGAMARFAWHPEAQKGRVSQIGLTGLIETPTYSGDAANAAAYLKAPFPTKVSDVPLVSATVDHTRNIFRLTPELLFARGRWGLEGQFYWTRIGRRDNFTAYNATGAYVLGRVLLNKGAAYGYSAEPAALATPRPGSWEIVAGWSYAELDDAGAKVMGGRANEATVTFNCYLHKYVTWRVNYAYASRRGVLHTNIFQTRIQFVF